MKLYIICGVCAALFFAYFAGSRIATERCRADVANATTNAQTEIIKIKREINEKVFNTGVLDIRDRLRAEYTIAD